MASQWTWLWHISAKAVEDGGIAKTWHRLVLATRLLRWRQALSPFAPGRVKGSLARDLAARPEMLGAVAWPYLCAGWTPRQRLAAIAGHYRLVDQQAPILDFPVDQQNGLLELGDVHPGLRVVLDKPHWFMREGQAVINLFLGTDRLFSLAFTLGLQDGMPVAYVGAVQGVRGDGVTDAYRDLTKALHGMRPRDFLIDVFREFCAAIGLQRVLAVCDAARHHRDSYFRSDKLAELFADYDAVWQERGGVRAGGADFFALAPAFSRRELEDVPSKKRAMYRRRYELLEALAVTLRQACERQRHAIRWPVAERARPARPSRAQPDSRWRRLEPSDTAPTPL